MNLRGYALSIIPANTYKMANMTSAMRERYTMLYENSQGGYELVWEVKGVFPKKMAGCWDLKDM